MLLNMDRNTLWGSAGGMVFEHETSWCAKDRFEWVEKQSTNTLAAAGQNLAGNGEQILLFNPANWSRTEPLRLKLPLNTSISGAKCEATADGTAFCQLSVPASGIVSEKLKPSSAPHPKAIKLPATIETKFYYAKIDPVTGALMSLKNQTVRSRNAWRAGKRRRSRKNIPADGEPGDYVNPRPKRQRLASSSDFKTTLAVTEGPLAVTVDCHRRIPWRRRTQARDTILQEFTAHRV